MLLGTILKRSPIWTRNQAGAEKLMQIGLDITQTVKRHGRGISRYIRQVVPSIVALEPNVILYIRGERWFRRSLVKKFVPVARRRWLPFGSSITHGDIDTFHSFGNHLPLRAKVPLSFTLHDIRALEQPAGYEGKKRLQ